MQGYLAVRHWNEEPGLLPLRNGVLDLSSKKLLPHSPGYRLTWQLPYDFNPMATCEPIQAWMLEAMKGDRSLVELLRAFLNAILNGRTDLQRFLECLGPGGTGKSTYARLAIALVGIKNTFTTELKHLEQNRFESAGIYGKRLVLIADSERYGGPITTIKAMTGQDPLRYEQKNRQQGSSFIPKAMVMICANEPIQSADYTSGLQRRRLTVPFIHQVKPSERRDLITVTSTTISGEFVFYLPGLLNWVLAMTDERATDLIINTETSVPGLNQWKAESLLESNPIAEWLDARIVVDPTAKTYVGTAEKIRLTEGEPANTVAWDAYRNADRWLYANYVEFASQAGSKAISIRRFGDIVKDLCNSQLNLGVKTGRDREGSFFEGLAIRQSGDEAPRPITQQTLQAATPGSSTAAVGVSLATPYKTTPTVTGCDSNVMAETLASEGYDGCDGLFETESIKEDLNKYTLPHKNAFPLYREERAGKSITSVTSTTGGTSSHHTSVIQSCFSVTGDGCAKHAAPATPEKQDSSENSVDPWEGIE